MEKHCEVYQNMSLLIFLFETFFLFLDQGRKFRSQTPIYGKYLHLMMMIWFAAVVGVLSRNATFKPRLSFLVQWDRERESEQQLRKIESEWEVQASIARTRDIFLNLFFDIFLFIAVILKHTQPLHNPVKKILNN